MGLADLMTIPIKLAGAVFVLAQFVMILIFLGSLMAIFLLLLGVFL